MSHVLSGIGAKTYAVLRDLLAPNEPKDSELATIKQKLVKHYKPKPPVIAQRFIFYQRTQKPGETINQFMMELRHLARTCDYISEGSVSHINGVRPSFLENTAVSRYVIILRMLPTWYKTHAPRKHINTHLVLTPSAFFSSSPGVGRVFFSL